MLAICKIIEVIGINFNYTIMYSYLGIESKKKRKKSQTLKRKQDETILVPIAQTGYNFSFHIHFAL